MSTTPARPNPPEHWNEALKHEFVENYFNGAVGDALLSETDDVRVWRIHLKPGERIGFHRHVLDYFWVAVTAGRARSHHANGEARDLEYKAGDVRHYAFGDDDYMVHDLMNIGDTDLIFTTVEFKRSNNRALPLAPGIGGRQ
ncbi:hypothetical protein [Labrys neptuniae]